MDKQKLPRTHSLEAFNCLTKYAQKAFKSINSPLDFGNKAGINFLL